MSTAPVRLVRGALLPLMAAALIAGCRDEATPAESPLATDTALARDLAVAQRDAGAPLIFNDAPLDAPAPVPAADAPAPRRDTPRASRPAPRPAPPRAAAPAPVSRPTVPAAAPAPAPARAVIGAGTRVGLTLDARVCAAAALPGDKFTATVSSTAAGSNGAAIPAGATVVLEITSVDRSDPIERSRIGFRVRSIAVNGDDRPADGEVVAPAGLEAVGRPTNDARTKVVGGAIAGAVIGRILGGSTKATVIGGAAGAAAGTAAARRGQSSDACLPTGSPMQLTLARDLVVQTPSF